MRLIERDWFVFPRLRRVGRRLGFVIAGVLGLAPLLQSPPAFGQQIWFSPNWGPAQSGDFLDLLRPGSPWQEGASQVNIISMSALVIAKAPDADLQGIFQALRARHIALGIPLLSLPGEPGGCGFNVEGYSAPAGSLANARKIKSLGGTVDYYTLDEPLEFGHMFTHRGERNGCQYSIDQIAAFVAERVRQVRSVFPAVQIGDGEPLMTLGDSTWEVDLEHWFDAYKTATGERLAYFRVDNRWNAAWRERLPPLVRLLSRKGIALQMIYNGGLSRSDEEWIANAKTHFMQVEGEEGVRPATAVIQSWERLPSSVLPETAPGTLTYLLREYVRWRATRH